MKHPVHLNALRAFEASARLQSFSAAAVELHVTPAAVGQLVKTLEAWLGAPLFIRSAGGKSRLVPTDAALRALPDIQAGFMRLGHGLQKLSEGAPNGILTVAISPAFAAKWLLPRIDRFQDAWPEIDVRLDTNLKPVDFVAQGIDIGVRYGPGRWQGLESVKLMDEVVYPVCSPEFLKQRRRVVTAQDVAGATLIHDLSMDGHAGFPTWEVWLEAVGVSSDKAHRGLQINNSAAVLQAAIDGRGIALARSVMARDDVVAGRLVRLLPEIEVRSLFAYYIVFRRELADLPKLISFRDWLLSEART